MSPLPKFKSNFEEIKEDIEEENKVSVDMTYDSHQQLFNIQKFIGNEMSPNLKNKMNDAD